MNIRYIIVASLHDGALVDSTFFSEQTSLPHSDFPKVSSWHLIKLGADYQLVSVWMCLFPVEK